MNINPVRLDRYELQELLGQSGVAEVWKAFDTHSHRYVAIKFLHANLQADPDFSSRFQREAQAIASLHHPNIVQYYEFSVSQPPGTTNITGYMVMDYVDGGSLAGYIRNTSRQGIFPPATDIVRLFSSICAGVDYAHQRNIVHGHLSPTNVLLDKYNTMHSAIGEPVITDFGIVKLSGSSTGNSGGWFSSPVYTSPEQIMGTHIDQRSDIYSLGVMLYELCTGTPPFPGNNPATIMMQHINKVPTLPSLINPALPLPVVTIIMRCLAKDPAARFSNVSFLIAALAQSLGQEGKEAPGVPLPENVSGPDYASGSVDVPTVMDPRPSASPGISGASFASFSPTEAVSASSDQGRQAAAHYTTPSSGISGSSLPYTAVQRGGPLTPALSTSMPGRTAQSLPPEPYGPPPVQPPASPPKMPRRRGLWIALSVLLLLVVVGGSLGTYFAFFFKGVTSTTTTTAQAASSIVGHTTFASSGLLSSNPQRNQGITDQVQIRMDNISPPASGMSYYAWLLNERSLPWNPLSLGELKVNNGTAALTYADAEHTNLLSTNSRFLITEESAASPPLTPSLNSATWRYYAEFSEKKPKPSDPKSYSLYDHIRHLLANDPKVSAAGLSVGLDIWLYRNTEKILELAGSARDAQKSSNAAGNADFIHRQLARIIDYLDGTTFTQLSQDLPGQPVLVDPAVAKIGLLTFDAAKQDPLGYLYHIGTRHLHEMVLLPQISPDQKALAIQINQELGVVNAWLETMRADVLQLYNMPAAQVFGSEGRVLLDTIATLANTAFVGQVNSQGQVTPGVVQIHYDIQRLATFDIQACTGNSPCPVV